ncbi:MAG: acetyl/propionyl-CoA carboxylase subunit alpha [Rhodospirillaceae bacterium]|nr:acetyl/propionyl-CoA carboxylase subunit alpha [Rhodospirillaceae bacterium]MBE89027.1 acetyl/propionyl-CoA carboxylase subunit alpha [Rhodospirillaceae bacterium]
MFSKILIANRGEIACRIMRTAKRMGIGTVAVYSDVDASALHVRMADEAFRIGPAPASQSYLAIENILEAVAQSGADAVHPGYGFLSENAEFTKALREKSITFIGPEPEAIAAMGDKIESKKIAAKSGVSTIPGHMGVVKGAMEAASIADDIGYPVMIKASAGGGGKGMRVAYSDKELTEGFKLAASEAKASFGDDRIFIEKFIEQPRHIEIQVLGDQHGNLVHLGERECSIQRRHQKVIEEAPSPFLDAKTRDAMGSQAVKLCKAVNYSSAGTVEFIVDKDKNFFFLEMNTRLQVEHPVTEYVTGIDLVEQMITVAAGEELSFKQSEIAFRGWAIEARLYAEDPARGFLPSTGRLVRYREPQDKTGVRIDSGVVEGSEISVFYDPMIAKLIASGTTRERAVERLASALGGYTVQGISHNLPFLTAVTEHDLFRTGDFTTNFIAEEFPDGFESRQPTGLILDRLIAIAGFAKSIFQARGIGPVQAQYVAVLDNPKGQSFDLTVSREGGAGEIFVHEAKFAIETEWRPGLPTISACIDGEIVNVHINQTNLGFHLVAGAFTLDIILLAPARAAHYRQMPIRGKPDMSKFLLSPMPGLLVRLSVDQGDSVKAGEELAVVEAMKMENVLRAERDGVIAKLNAEVGANLNLDQVILEFDNE